MKPHVFTDSFIGRCKHCNLTKSCLAIRQSKGDHSRDKCRRTDKIIVGLTIVLIVGSFLVSDASATHPIPPRPSNSVAPIDLWNFFHTDFFHNKFPKPTPVGNNNEYLERVKDETDDIIERNKETHEILKGIEDLLNKIEDMLNENSENLPSGALESLKDSLDNVIDVYQETGTQPNYSGPPRFLSPSEYPPQYGPHPESYYERFVNPDGSGWEGVPNSHDSTTPPPPPENKQPPPETDKPEPKGPANPEPRKLPPIPVDIVTPFPSDSMGPPIPADSVPVPVAFKTSYLDTIKQTPVGDDQCKIWPHNGLHKKLWMFAAYNQEEVCMSVKLSGDGYLLFIDKNYNEKMDNCEELLCNFYYSPEEQKNAYDKLAGPEYDTNNDGWFGIGDYWWPQARAWKISDETIHKMEDIESYGVKGIIGFSTTGYIEVKDDYLLRGQYANGKYHNEDYAYHNAIKNGWKPEYYSSDELRIEAIHYMGFIMSDRITTGMTMDFWFGYWTHEQVESSLDGYPEEERKKLERQVAEWKGLNERAVLQEARQKQDQFEEETNEDV